MPRFAALVLHAFATVVVTATPAPEPMPWVTGWQKADPRGDCRFAREGERLTIMVPGKDHKLDLDKKGGGLEVPRLLRNVEGDFVVEVRVSGKCWYSREADGCRGAGILVKGGEKDPMVAFELQGRKDDGEAFPWVHGQIKYPEGPASHQACRLEPEAEPRLFLTLRLERRGEILRMSYSEDCKEWTELLFDSKEIPLPPKLKVGVFAEADVEGSFDVVFDHFKLSRPRRSP